MQGAWCITVRVSGPALAQSGAMPHALCPMQKYSTGHRQQNAHQKYDSSKKRLTLRTPPVADSSRIKSSFFCLFFKRT